MTKVHKVICTCLLLLVGIGCTKQEEVIRDEIVKSGEVYLSFETSFANNQEDDLRVISWRMGGLNGRPLVSLNRTQTDNRHPAVVVIRNKDARGASTKTYYLEADFYRVGENTFRLGSMDQNHEVRLGKDIYGTEIQLNYSDEWYMMAFFKGSWDKDNKTMSYTPNKPDWIVMSDGQVTAPIEQPLILPWTKMIYGSGDGGKLILAPERGSTIKPMGTIISVKFHNTTASLRSVRRIALYSNVLSSGVGHYKLDPANLPALSSMGTNADAPTWYPTEVANNGYFNSGYKSMKRNGGIHTPNHPSGAQDWVYPVIWAMPIANTSSDASKTEVRVELGWDDPGTVGRTRQVVAYENVVWSSMNRPTHGSTLGVMGKITDTEIPGTRKKSRPANNP